PESVRIDRVPKRQRAAQLLLHHQDGTKSVIRRTSIITKRPIKKPTCRKNKKSPLPRGRRR
ncbi:unnamed protein product, partial [Amoebophrya sp. A120]